MRSNISIGGVEFNLQLTLIIVLSTTVAIIDFYGYSITGTKAYDRFILYFVIPMIVILLLFREKPAAYGFRVGDWRVGLIFTIAGCLGMAIILWFVARTPSMDSYYSDNRFHTHCPDWSILFFKNIFIPLIKT